MKSSSVPAITWLGHSAFLIEMPSGVRLLTDPWLGNPKCPDAFKRPEALGKVDVILLSHGHADHASDIVAVARATGAPVVCVAEIDAWLTGKGIRGVRGMNIGGTQTIGDLRITMTTAVHSGSFFGADGIVYLGGATGFVVRAPDAPTFYFAGDTALFGDMKIIAELYRPDIAFLPIGDHYTMGPDTAALAARWLGVRQVVPMHWGTFPVLTGTPEALRAALGSEGIEVLDLSPGETAR